MQFNRHLSLAQCVVPDTQTLSRKKRYLRFEILKSVSIVLFALMLFAAAALVKELI